MKIYSYGDIKKVTKKGIYMKNGYCIYFSECLSNAREYLKDEATTCVAEIDITANPPYFAFYTDMGEIIQFDIHKGLFAQNNYNDFHHLQTLLQKMNFTTKTLR